MGVGLRVGIQADLELVDYEGYEWSIEQMSHVSARLTNAGLAEHCEPDSLASDQIFHCDLMGHGNLHRLRRLAAWLAVKNSLPDETTDKPCEDPVYMELYFDKLAQNDELPFQHLINHSDAEGFYVPQAFPQPLPHDEETKMASGPLGSTQQLLAECDLIASKLDLLIMEQDFDSCLKLLFPPAPTGFLNKLFKKGNTAPSGIWQAFSNETLTCLQLMRGCEASLRTGAAIAFR